MDGEPTVPRLGAVTVISPLDSLLNRLGLPGAVPPTPPEPVFTVIVRTQGRRPRSLREALASLAAQTRPGFDALVAVHGPDSAAAGVEAALKEAAAADPGSLPDRWSVLSVEGGGRGRPLNAGLDAARGDYVAFLDDDDLAGPDWLEVFARGAAEAPGRIIRAACGVQTWAVAGTAEPQAPLGPVDHPYADRFDLLAHLSHSETPICSVALPRLGLERFGLRFDEDLQVCEDWDLIVRAAPADRRSLGGGVDLAVPPGRRRQLPQRGRRGPVAPRPGAGDRQARGRGVRARRPGGPAVGRGPISSPAAAPTPWWS